MSCQTNGGKGLSHRFFHINPSWLATPITGGHGPLDRRSAPSDKIQERLDIRQKLVLAAYGTPLMTKVGLAEFGIDEPLDDGPVLPREERIQQVLAQAR